MSMPASLCSFLSVMSGFEPKKRGVSNSRTNQIGQHHLFTYYQYINIHYLPVMNAHGVGFRLPNEPFFMHDFSACIGAENVNVDRMAPIVGHT